MLKYLRLDDWVAHWIYSCSTLVLETLTDCFSRRNAEITNQNASSYSDNQGDD